MPTYEYACDACGSRFEKFQSITAAPVKRCPECGKSRARRLIGTGAGLIFKGSGFYITDYRSESYKQAASQESGKSDGKPDGGKPDAAKPETPKTDSTKPEPAKAGKPSTKPAKK